MQIAILDDGIDTTVCQDIVLTHDLIVDELGNVRPREYSERVLTDHGTTCTQIIHKYAPEAAFCSICIFSGPDLKANILQLVGALQWCLRNDIPMIHMSVGSTRLTDYSQIRSIVAKLQRQGCVLVAAQSNHKFRYTMPACFSGIFGIAADPSLCGSAFRIESTSLPDRVQIFASSNHSLIMGPNGVRKTHITNSYAAPTITAHLHQLLTRFKSISPQELYRKLASDPAVSLARISPDFLDAAIIYDPDQTLAAHPMEFAFFQRSMYFSENEAFLCSIVANQAAPVLLVPSASEGEKFFADLFRYSTKRSGIAYAGVAPQAIREGAPCLFWDESVYEPFFAGSTGNLADESIPVLHVEPWGEAAFKFMCRFRSLLMSKGYGCTGISDYSFAYLYNLLFVPDGINFSSLLFHVVQSYCPDLILCMVRTCDTPGDEDLRVYLSAADNKAASFKDDEVTLPISPTEEQLIALYEWLIEE